MHLLGQVKDKRGLYDDVNGVIVTRETLDEAKRVRKTDHRCLRLLLMKTLWQALRRL